MKHCYRIRQSTNKSKKHTLLKTMLIFICFLLLTSMASANSVVDSVKSIIENPQNGIDAEKTLQDVFDSLGYSINVATDETGIETFCALPGQNIATIIVEYAGSAVSAKSGWYLANDSSVLHQLFSGSDVTGDSTQFTVTGGSSIGFYMKPGLGGSPEDVWFTQNSMSAGSDDFAWVFKTGVPHEYIIAWEDVPGGDYDYQDLVIKVRFANQVPVVTIPPAYTDYSVSQCSPAPICFPISATDANCEGDELTLIMDSGVGSFTPINQVGPINTTHCFTPTTSGVYQFVFKVTDEVGDFSYATTDITVTLNADPVITCPADITINCNDSSDPSNTGTATATDDSGTPTITYSDTETAGSCPQEKVITRTWTATDGCSATDQCVQTITVVDTTDPIITCPADVTVECDASTDPSATGTATATDNCDATLTITYSDVTVSGIFIIRTWTATDDCGNEATCDQTITIEDTTSPDISCPTNITIECDESTDPSNTGTATATDNCDASVTITYSDTEVAGACADEKVITRTWTATDDDSNTATCDQTITVVDTTDPIITCPADIAIECDESIDPSNTGTATATDNCDATLTITSSDVTAGNIITRTWTATDDCGNDATCDQTITINDTTDPVITCPANITIECDESTDPSNTGSATATDNCDTSPIITFTDSEAPGTCPQEKVITRTWTATDEYSNNVSCNQTIIVVDNTDPIITCPADITIECDESTDPSNTGTATATDNCDASVAITYSDATVGNIITRTWTATDDCGNDITCDQLITLNDTTDPVITCPANITVECDASTDPSATGTATATDNCDASPTVTYSDTETAGSCPQEKTITRTWTATDDDSNSADCVQTITVVDTTDPIITCPADVTVECDSSTDPSTTGTATATDNCDASVVVTYSDATVGYIITRTWTATDDCGNDATCDQTITVEDTTDPVIACPADVTIECDTSTDPSATGTATATDNCDASPTVTYSDTETTGSCPQEKTIIRTWTATDNDSNTATCDQTITVVDTTDPIITCPTDVTVECDGSTDPSATGTATATDNCDASVAITYSDATVGNVITRTWTATDDCGNDATCDQTLTINDTTDPVITCPADVTIECDDSTDPSATGTATATDNCDTSPTITYSDTETAGSCAQEKIITRTWTATDDASNTADCIQTITVVDTTDPVITCPADVTVECANLIDPSETGTATVTDNCDASVAITYSDATVGNVITRTWTATDDCGNDATCDQTITVEDTTDPVITCPADVTVECDDSTDPSATGTATATDNCDASPTVTYSDTETAGSCPQEKVITRTWTAIDDDNNAVTCDQTITVVDTTDPVITCPADITIECDASTDPSATGTATATDNCDASIAITYSDVTVDNVITRTWIATDDCGNDATCDQLLTINDTIDPVITCPSDISIECDIPADPSNTGTATATDNCDASPTITYSDTETAGSCPQEKVITRTWTAVDDASNSDQCVQTITIVDTTDPIITCPDDVYYECGGDTDPSATGSATATDNCSTPVISYSDDVNGEVITRTWTATDDCGNSSSCDQVITDVVNAPPVVSCPGDKEQFVCDLSPIAIGGFNCSDPDGNLATCEVDNGTLGGGSVSFTPVAGVNTITLTATDDCGETAECTYTITVTVNTPPVAHCPGDMTVYLFELDEICVPGFYCDDVDDNLATCDVNVGNLIGDEVCFTPVEGDNQIIITATDDCGAGSKGSSECIMNVNVVLVSDCPMITISTEQGVLQGHNRDVTVTINNATYEIGGYDFLIAYDASAISLISVEPMGFFDDCEWEYFTYRHGADGNCGDACPSGIVRVFALAETNDGYHSPTCLGPPDQGEYDLFSMRFFVTNDRTFECNFTPINFFWGDCGDNSISSPSGDTLFVDKIIYDFAGNMIWDEENDTDFPDENRLPFIGISDNCIENPDPGKPKAIRCVDFTHGGINIICADSIDDRGDLNLNGVSNEIADAVVLTNYFTHGIEAFVINAEGQIAASDANADGIPLSVADLVYIIRVIVGDVHPIDKIVPYKSTVNIGIRGPIIVADVELGGGAFVFEGNVNVELTDNASHMQIETNYDGENTRVVIFSFNQGAVFSGEILRAEGKLLAVEASDYFGNILRVGPLPHSFSLTNYPNPFNPSTTIEMNLPVASDWTLNIYNVSGQKVGAFNGTDEAGLIKVSWDATGQSSGIYFIKAQAGDFKSTKKAILIK